MYNQITIENNRIYNVIVPIAQAAANHLQGTTSIQYNTIGLYSPDVDRANYPPNGQVLLGIDITGVFVGSVSTTSQIVCSNNTIEDAVAGIHMSDLILNNVNIDNNSIKLKEGFQYNDVGTFLLDGYGILMEGTQGTSDESNSISGNYVEGDNATYSSAPSDWFGIGCNQSDHLRVACNAVTQCVSGLAFGGDNTPAIVRNNSMNPSNNSGFLLDYSAIIGTQGNSTIASDNDWLVGNSSWLGFKTNCLHSSDAIYSTLNVQNTSNLNPSGSNDAGGGGSPYSAILGSIVTVSPTIVLTCDEGERNPTNRNVGHYQRGTNTEAAELIASGHMHIASPDSALRLYVMQQQLYTALTVDSAMVNQSIILQSFIQANSSSNLGTINRIGKAIAANDSATASNLLQNMSGGNRVDDNYTLFFNWLLINSKLLRSANLSQINTTDIYNVAQRCPFTDGIVVYAARNLYNSIVKIPVRFKNNCGGDGHQDHKPLINNLSFKVYTNEIFVYPNPSLNGIVTVTFSDKVKSIKTLTVTDVYGKIIFRKGNINSWAVSTINIKGPKGIYLLTTTDNNTRKKETTKILIP